MCSPSAPPPPDYEGAAEATAAGDLEAARLTTLANRPDIYTPEGSRTWTQGGDPIFDQAGYDKALADYNARIESGQTGEAPTTSNTRANKLLGTIVQGIDGKGPISEPTRDQFTTYSNPDKWTGTVNLNPEAQKAFDANQRMATGLANLGESAVDQVGDLFSSQFSTTGDVPGYRGPASPMPTYGENRQSVVDAMMSRVNTDIGRDRETTNSNLIARGLPQGSEAYQREMEQLDRKQTDARQQAEIAAQSMAGQEYSSALAGRGLQNKEAMADYTTGLDSRRQGIQEALLNRQTPLNEISAFRSGSQVGIPQFQPYGNQTFTGGPDYTGATTAAGNYALADYNAQQAGRNNLMNGMFSLGAGGLAGGYF